MDIATAANGPLWLQLYWLKRRDLLVGPIRRVRAAGFRALVLTVEAPRVAFYPRDAANGFAVPPGIRAVNVAHDVMAASHGSRDGSRPSPGTPRSRSTPRSPGRTSPGCAK